MSESNFNSNRSKCKTKRTLMGLSNTSYYGHRPSMPAVKFRVHITVYELADGQMSVQVECRGSENRALSWDAGKQALECARNAIEQAIEFQRKRLRLLDRGLDLYGDKFSALNPLGEQEE